MSRAYEDKHVAVVPGQVPAYDQVHSFNSPDVAADDVHEAHGRPSTHRISMPIPSYTGTGRLSIRQSMSSTAERVAKQLAFTSGGGDRDTHASVNSLASLQSLLAAPSTTGHAYTSALGHRARSMADLQLLVFSLLALVVLLFAGHVEDVGQPAFLVFSICIAILFIIYAVLRCFKVLDASSLRPVSLVLAYTLCSLISLAAPSRRRELLGLARTEQDEACEEGVIALWIVFILAFVTVFSPMPRRFMFVFGQLVCLQHLLLGLILERPECASSVLRRGGPGGFLLGLPPIWTSSLLLHVLAALFAVMHTHFDTRRCIEASALQYIEQIAAQREQQITNAASNESDDHELHNWIEKLVSTLSNEERAGRDFLNQAAGDLAVVDLSMMPGEMRAWTIVVDSLLDVLEHCERQLTSFSGSDVKWRKDMKAQILKQTENADTGVSEFLCESWMATENFSSAAPASSSSLPPDKLMDSAEGLDNWCKTSRCNSPDGEQRDVDSTSADLSVGAPNIDDDNHSIPSVSGLRHKFDICDWSFDAIQCERQQGHVLQVVGYEILKNYHFIRRSVLKDFLRVLESKYVETNSYHSHIHAADMCNAFFYQVSKTESVVLGDLPATTHVAMYIAALAHDVGHFERNNGFLINFRHPLAVTYNDKSVMENHHASTLVDLLSKQYGRKNGDSHHHDNHYVLGTFSHDQMREARQLMVSLILGTDTQMHLEDLAAFRLRLGASNFDSVNSPSDRHQTLGLIFRASDIGHSAKSWELHQQWSRRVVSEFHAQGDEEKRLGLKVSPLCEREGFVMASSQVGFLQFICLPTWKELARWEEHQLEERARSTQLGYEASKSLQSRSSKCSASALLADKDSGRPNRKQSVSSVLEKIKHSAMAGKTGDLGGEHERMSRQGSIRSVTSEASNLEARRHLAEILALCELNAKEWKNQAEANAAAEKAAAEKSPTTFESDSSPPGTSPVTSHSLPCFRSDDVSTNADSRRSSSQFHKGSNRTSASGDSLVTEQLEGVDLENRSLQ